jgi:hypothetical protein
MSCEPGRYPWVVAVVSLVERLKPNGLGVVMISLTGAVPLIAVGPDAGARRSRQARGRG